VLTAVNDEISPVPPADKPIVVFELVQEKVAPETGLVNEVPGTTSPLQILILEGTITEGVGFTVIVNEDDVPGQLFTVGTTAMVAVIGTAPLLAAV